MRDLSSKLYVGSCQNTGVPIDTEPGMSALLFWWLQRPIICSHHVEGPLHAVLILLSLCGLQVDLLTENVLDNILSQFSTPVFRALGHPVMEKGICHGLHNTHDTSFPDGLMQSISSCLAPDGWSAEARIKMAT